MLYLLLYVIHPDSAGNNLPGMVLPLAARFLGPLDSLDATPRPDGKRRKTTENDGKRRHLHLFSTADLWNQLEDLASRAKMGQGHAHALEIDETKLYTLWL